MCKCAVKYFYQLRTDVPMGFRLHSSTTTMSSEQAKSITRLISRSNIFVHTVILQAWPTLTQKRPPPSLLEENPSLRQLLSLKSHLRLLSFLPRRQRHSGVPSALSLLLWHSRHRRLWSRSIDRLACRRVTVMALISGILFFLVDQCSISAILTITGHFPIPILPARSQPARKQVEYNLFNRIKY